MTPYKNFSQNNTWTSRARKGALYLAVSAMLAVPTGCGSDNNGSDWEETTVEEPTKGVVTTVEETEPGKFTVVDEQVAETRDQSRVIVRHLDGKVDTMTLAQAKGMVGNQDTVRQTTVVHHHGGGFGLGHILWWSAMGHMMGRSFNSVSPSGIYRSPGTGTYTGVSSQLRSTALTRTEMRPIKGRSGFFGGSGRSRFGS